MKIVILLFNNYLHENTIKLIISTLCVFKTAKYIQSIHNIKLHMHDMRLIIVISC